MKLRERKGSGYLAAVITVSLTTAVGACSPNAKIRRFGGPAYDG